MEVSSNSNKDIDSNNILNDKNQSINDNNLNTTNTNQDSVISAQKPKKTSFKVRNTNLTRALNEQEVNKVPVNYEIPKEKEINNISNGMNYTNSSNSLINQSNTSDVFTKADNIYNNYDVGTKKPNMRSKSLMKNVDVFNQTDTSFRQV